MWPTISDFHCAFLISMFPGLGAQQEESSGVGFGCLRAVGNLRREISNEDASEDGNTFGTYKMLKVRRSSNRRVPWLWETSNSFKVGYTTTRGFDFLPDLCEEGITRYSWSGAGMMVGKKHL